MGMTAGGGQHKFKTKASRAKRRAVTQCLSTGNYDGLPNDRKYGNEWDSPRDGKQYLINPDPKWMRK